MNSHFSSKSSIVWIVSKTLNTICYTIIIDITKCYITSSTLISTKFKYTSPFLFAAKCREGPKLSAKTFTIKPFGVIRPPFSSIGSFKKDLTSLSAQLYEKQIIRNNITFFIKNFSNISKIDLSIKWILNSLFTYLKDIEIQTLKYNFISIVYLN